jgi:hypothetical protein
VLVFEDRGAEVALKVFEVKGQVAVRDIFWGVVAVAFVWRDAFDDPFAEVGERAPVDDFALPQGVLCFEAAEEVGANVFDVDVVAEDDVEINFVPARISAAERVQA